MCLYVGGGVFQIYLLQNTISLVLWEKWVSRELSLASPHLRADLGDKALVRTAAANKGRNLRSEKHGTLRNRHHPLPIDGTGISTYMNG